MPDLLNSDSDVVSSDIFNNAIACKPITPVQFKRGISQDRIRTEFQQAKKVKKFILTQSQVSNKDNREKLVRDVRAARVCRFKKCNKNKKN